MTNRTQFSISMDPEVKAKLEKLAGLKQVTLAQFIEMIGKEKIATVDQETWDIIEKLQAKLNKDDMAAPAAAARRRGK